VLMIVDHEGGRSRLLSIDDAGVHEQTPGGLDAVAGEVGTHEPDLILVNPEAVALSGANFVQELNRLLRFHPGYSWTPAPGEMPAA
jgi:hypothetical protein